MSKTDRHLNMATTDFLERWKLRNYIIFQQVTWMDLAYPNLLGTKCFGFVVVVDDEELHG
jgi:hypothetical protein